MASHSAPAFPSFELCGGTGVQGVRTARTSSICFSTGEGFLSLRWLRRKVVKECPRRSGMFLSAAAAAGTAAADKPASEESKAEDARTRLYRMPTLHSMVDPQPFKIIPVEQGGHKNWHPAKVLSIKESAPGVRVIVIEAEISREMVPLENAYTTAGRLAQLRLNGEKVVKVVAASAPFTLSANEAVLIKARGDIPAGTTKQPQYFLSVKHPLELIVMKAETPQLFSLKEGDEVELGPFDYSGLDLRPILFLSRYPTILFFASGKGIGVAKAIIEAKDNDAGSMNLSRREDIRLFYWSLNPSDVLYQEKFETWESKKLKVRPAVGKKGSQEWDGHVGTFTSLWDEDDIEYDPFTTGAIVSVDTSLKKEVDKLLAEAGIPEKQILRWEPSFSV